MIKKKLRLCLTNKCNFKCIYCWSNGEGSNSNNQDLSQEDLLTIVKHLSVNYMFSFIRLTGGEPLLRKGFYEIVAKLDSTKCFDKITMVTNGSLINYHVANKLSKLNFKSITVSLDTLKNDIFKKMTGVDYLDNVCNAIKYLVDNKVNVKLSSVITKSNRHDVFDLIDFASNLSIPIKLLDYVAYDDTDSKNNYQPFDEIKQKLKSASKKIDIQFQDEGFGVPEEVYYIENAIVEVKDSSLGSCYSHSLCNNCKKYPCQSGIVSFVLTNDGILKLCNNEDNNIDLKPIIHHDDKTINRVEKLINNYEQSHRL